LNPKLIVADEPVLGSSNFVQHRFVNLFPFAEEFQLTYLSSRTVWPWVEHISTRVAVMYLGRIVEVANANRTISARFIPYTQALMSAIPVPIQRRTNSRCPARRRAHADQSAFVSLSHPLPDRN